MGELGFNYQGRTRQGLDHRFMWIFLLIVLTWVDCNTFQLCDLRLLTTSLYASVPPNSEMK